jgi:hypothetical protein
MMMMTRPLPLALLIKTSDQEKYDRRSVRRNREQQTADVGSASLLAG